MAAKVVMVAVPTVLGIASIRVYTVEEAPADGLVSREKLNFYTQLAPSAPTQFVPERPGLIQTGVTAAREGILPLVRAVKGACYSLKNGTVNVYHAGEDIYYYLKDPPPEFLPRFGTITMAGLLGMFLTRKASRFKRVAVPLGLMSAGASVCYPAQTVAVVKVTGKKLYAVGQQSGAAVSSLFSPKPQEPITKEPPPLLPQAVAVAEEAPEAQIATVPETKVPESAESAPASAVVSEEASSLPLSEKSPDRPTTDDNTDPVAESVPTEIKNITISEEVPAPVEKAALAEAVPVETASAEAALLESAPIATASAVTPQVEAAPLESAPVQAASEESDPLEAPLAEDASGEDVPREAADVESVPTPEEPSGPEISHDPSAEPALLPPFDPADPPQVAAVEEAPTTPPQQFTTEDSKGGDGFKPDPALMDFGQSSPEDEDLYSTRS
ncbi:MICOS complex subunit MIC27 isoform X2 [Antennarius striatus]|uniref:MICOS complex subunit MIC27 isoform X2 n=1 Tax=Antennarius striatus TaxID=241820 RepID=UPI0035B11F9F